MTKRHHAEKKVERADHHLAELAAAAAKAGDLKLVKLCGKALAGNAKARRECERMHATTRSLAKHMPAEHKRKHKP